jgi:hypothetical protein
MTNPGNSPESPKKGFKLTLMQGVVGAASLVGTTAIPLIVQRALTPPTPISSPIQSPPAEIKPAPATASPQNPSGTVTQDDEDVKEGKGKKKGKKYD